MQYYSEYGEDEWIHANVGLPFRGFYLDIGAGHPERGSNTAFLRDRGWLGLAIDAVEEYGPHWIGRQQFVCATLAQRDTVKFRHVTENSCISRIDDADPLARKRTAATLQHVLNSTIELASPKIEKIDFVSIDVEGAEFEVFCTFHWERYDPRIIVAEYVTQGIGVDFRLRDFLLASGRYRVAHQTVSNLIFLRQ